MDGEEVIRRQIKMPDRREGTMQGDVVHSCHTYRSSSEFFLLIANSMAEVPALNLFAISATKIPISCSTELPLPDPTGLKASCAALTFGREYKTVC